MSAFEDAVIQRIRSLEREVERLQRWERPTGGGGVTDHGDLTGLADDDHPQYLLRTDKAADSDKLDGKDSLDFASKNHIHDHGSELTGLLDDDHTQYTKHPATSTDNAIVRWDGTGGRTIQNSGVTIDDSNNLQVPDYKTYKNHSLYWLFICPIDNAAYFNVLGWGCLFY